MNKLLKNMDYRYIDYFVIKEKIGNKFNDVIKYKNNRLNRFLLSIKKFDNNKELYLVPKYKNIEGYYIKIKK